MERLYAPVHNDLAEKLREQIVGQDAAIAGIVPIVQMQRSGLSPTGRPIANVLLLGPSGSGKTYTVETVAEVIHDNSKNVLKVDCGEYQQDHEIAKLIGSPPGYLGHRETPGVLTQAKINGVASEKSDISIILFDEIEKSSLGLLQILLGVFDKATLHLGNNERVNFERCLIFMTGNLGSAEMEGARNGYGLARNVCQCDCRKNAQIVTAAVKKRFAPEFVNRIDIVITFEPLTAAATRQILELELAKVLDMLVRRLGVRAPYLSVTDAAKEWLIQHGTSAQYGARELKRLIQREIVMRLAELNVAPSTRVVVDVENDRLEFFSEQAMAVG
jgi:ATP-dependent Clp protease ATP-binding subunit ClpA